MLTKFFSNLSSWSEFKSRLAIENTKTKGDAFELLTKYYLQIDPIYKTLIKSVWLLNEVPSDVKEALNLPAQDKGIDILAVTYSSEFWAIQCKYREDDDSSVTWDELSTFAGLSFSVCRGISFGLICTTSNRITATLSNQDKIGFCTGEIWRSLNLTFFNQLSTHLGKKPIEYYALSPKPHQASAIVNAKKHFITEDNTRGKMIMPCGTGKSITAFWISIELCAKSIIVAVPSLALIRQMLKAWLKESVAKSYAISWICVASDETVSKIDKDDLVILKQDLGIPTYTDSDKISSWLNTQSNFIKIVFTTYQSGKTISAATKKANFTFDFGIMDEAHKTVGSNKKLFSHLLFDENIAINKRLFMTATERRYAGLSDEILSMDNEDIYGSTFSLLSFKDAIEFRPPILSDYKIITIAVDKEEIKELIQQNDYIIPDEGNWNVEIEASMLASIIALQKAFAKFPIKHAVSFHSTINKAKIYKQIQSRYSEIFPDFKNISTYHISGKFSSSVRDKIIGEFTTSTPSLITNSRCLNEGVDIPQVDCILFADPKKSTIDIVQAVGRVLRISDGKEFGYIIIPILTDFNNSVLIDDNSYKDILITLRALAANDERIIDYFRNTSQGKVKSNLFVLETNDKIAKVINSLQFNESIYLKVWDRLGKLSWRSYEEAKDYINNYGFTNIKQWKEYCKGGYRHIAPKPSDIPSCPDQVYRGSGWISWGEWLRTKRIAHSLKTFRQFKEARIFVRSLKLNNSKEWDKYIKGELPGLLPKPPDIPAAPSQFYKNNGWKGMADWLGLPFSKKNKLIPFDELKISASSLVSKNLDNEVSVALPTNNSTWRPFLEAKKYINNYSFTNIKQWKEYCKGYYKHIPPKPSDIPSNPDIVYLGSGWISWEDWFHSVQILSSQKQFLNFVEAREFVRKLTLKNSVEWELYINGMYKDKIPLPLNIPTNPQLVYKKKGWLSWPDFLHTPTYPDVLPLASSKIPITTTKELDYCSYEVSRDFASKLKLKNYADWLKYLWGSYKNKPALPPYMPTNPHIYYADTGWHNWADFLGTASQKHKKQSYFRSMGSLPKKDYRNFMDARAFVQQLELKNYSEWLNYIWGKYSDKIALPDDIPSNPNQVYKGKGWVGYDDWLGVE